MKVKIVSDGTFEGTSVVDVDTGDKLENVRAVRWGGAEHSGCVVWLELSDVPAELVAEVMLPERKRVKSR